MNALKRILLITVAAPSLLVPALAVGVAAAAPAYGAPVAPVESSTAASNSSASTNTTDGTATRLANIKTKGDAEIARRLATLNTLSSKITAATKLTASDKATLSAEVNAEITGLTALKTKLDAETTVTAAAADVQSMVTEYRVYALIVPKIQLIRTADNQQTVQEKLTTLVTKLNTRIAAAQTAGKDVTTLRLKLAQLDQQISAATAISSSVETKVIAFQPSDYNADHTILTSDATQLKTAHQDNQTAYQDAKAIVVSLKAL